MLYWWLVVLGAAGYAGAFAWQISHTSTLREIILWALLMPVVWFPSSVAIMWGLSRWTGGGIIQAAAWFALAYNLALLGMALLNGELTPRGLAVLVIIGATAFLVR